MSITLPPQPGRFENNDDDPNRKVERILESAKFKSILAQIRTQGVSALPPSCHIAIHEIQRQAATHPDPRVRKILDSVGLAVQAAHLEYCLKQLS
jgi:hypothetical protein